MGPQKASLAFRLCGPTCQTLGRMKYLKKRIILVKETRLHFTLILFLPLFLIGCMHDKGESPTALNELEGSWKKNCHQDTEDSYVILINTYSGSTYSGEVYRYEDQDCTIPRSEFKTSGTYTVGESKIINSGDTVKEINMINLQWNLTLINQEYVDFFNTNNYCEKKRLAKRSKGHL